MDYQQHGCVCMTNRDTSTYILFILFVSSLSVNKNENESAVLCCLFFPFLRTRYHTYSSLVVVSPNLFSKKKEGSRDTSMCR
mmetsp:Transcript_39740/g.40224  ORF Transcript_39740/g.40224 Transcript_39740/m.40224 type:complete len:82 (+) Transcript_39740:196-441(+)